MRIFVAVVIIVVIVLGVAFGFVYSGVYDVAAMKPHMPPMAWMLDKTMEKSVHRHARGITSPNLADSAMVKLGFQHYDEMCVTCHGAPGIPFTEVSVGLYPPPPNLAESITDWTPAEAYWIIKNGVKDTGMPGFGKTHDEKSLWAMVAFAEQLPKMTPEQFGELKSELGDKDVEETAPSEK